MTTKKGPGKIFEANMWASIPKDTFFYRMKDDTSGFAGISNPGDCIIYSDGYMYVLELKTTKTTNVPVANLSDMQIKKLSEYSRMPGVVAGFVFNFREQPDNPTYFISGDTIANSIKNGIKSFNITYCQANGTEIQSTLKKIHHKYHIAEWLKQTKKTTEEEEHEQTY